MSAAAQIQKALFAMEDRGYKVFHSKLIPNVDPEQIIGVRMPELRQYLENRILSSWVHQLSIRKGIESNRVTQPQKAYLRALRETE